VKHIKHITLAFTLALSTAACVAEEGDEDIDDSEDTSSVEQGVYSPWYDVSGPYGSGVVRACKTATRINWEFGYNTYQTATTGGIGLSTLNSSIAGQSWGQKYRTRGGATSFWIALGTNGHSKAIGWPSVSMIPDC
jgi:hypothetical protein